MKKNILLILSAVLLILNGCKKDGTNNTTQLVVPGISIQTITYPSFANSTWSNIIGGPALIQFNLLGSGGTVTSTITDSTNEKNISSYSKTLSNGVYDIDISSKNQSAAADTFLRFNALLKSYSVSSHQALSLTATSTDGLITIGQSFVMGNTVPTFKTDTGTKAYKFGLSNGFYYLYVKGGLNGNVTFTSKTGNQIFTKSLSITALTQYNMALQTNNGSLQVVFVPFVYNQVAVSSNTLVTLKIDPNLYIGNSTTWFVVTDGNGNILNEVKLIPGTKTFKITSLQPFQQDRFNLFEIDIRNDGSNTVPGITGYLQIKKGSTFAAGAVLYYHSVSSLNPHLKNETSFDQLSMSTNYSGVSINSLSDSSRLNFGYPDSSKLWVQMLKNNQYTYNFFNIPPGTVDLNVDLTKLTETPLMQTISAPGTNMYVDIAAKTNPAWGNAYDFGQMTSQNGSVNYYYPSEPFPYYETRISYYSASRDNYYMYTSGPAITTKATPINASFTKPGTTLADFAPSDLGVFDYYHASFIYGSNGPYLQVVLYSPSAGNYTNVKLPDFSKYLGLKSLDLSTQVLKYFELVKVNIFDETKLMFNTANGGLSQPVNYQSVSHSY